LISGLWNLEKDGSPERSKAINRRFTQMDADIQRQKELISGQIAQKKICGNRRESAVSY